VRIAHVTPAFHPAHHYGGPPESAFRLSMALGELGHEVRVLTTDANGPVTLDVETNAERFLGPGVTVCYCPRRLREATAPSLLLRLGEYLRWCDVVHLNAVYNFTSLPTLALARALDKPVVWSTRGALQGGVSRRSRALKRAWERVAARVAPTRLVLHATSEQEAAESAVLFPGVAVEVIPNGVVLPPPITRRPRGDRLVLGALGRLHPIKGLDRLISAVALCVERGAPAVALRLAGGGEAVYHAQLEDQVRRLGLSSVVTFLGPIEGDAKLRFFESIDVLVAPSLRENFGIAIAEALAHGVPVIASRGTPWAILEEAEAGLWVDNTAASLLDAFVRIAACPLERLGTNARMLVEREFAWGRAAAAMATVYERLRVRDIAR
jgi:glycosyltransferase involved in cell wall biosynthesis